MTRRPWIARTGHLRGDGSQHENPLLLLVNGATTTVETYAGHPALGRFIQPRSRNCLTKIAASGMRWAADNDALAGIDPDAYLAFLDRIAVVDTTQLLFVAVPDAVRKHGNGRIAGDANATLWMFGAWLPALQRRGLPPALVAQDGLTAGQTPWDDIAALFIGGSTAWKLGPAAAALIGEARRRDVWVHVGRVNSLRRLDYFDALGANSFDGYQFSAFAERYLPRYLARLEYRQWGFFDAEDTAA